MTKKFVVIFCLIVGLLGGQSVWAITPNDPEWQEVNGVSALQLPAAWDITTGSPEVVVAIIDTGVDTTNPDIAANIWSNPNEKLDGTDNDRNGFIDDVNGWNFVDNTPNVRPVFSTEATRIGMSHGSVVAGIIGAVGNNYLGTAGVNWQVKLMPLKILDESGNGDSDAAVQAIDYAIAQKVSVINLSFVGPTPSLNFIQAIRRAHRAGIPVVAAAGNGSDVAPGINLDILPQYPVCFDDPLKEENWVMGVAALDENGLLAKFSNFGSRCIDISAPGAHLPSTLFFDPQRGYGEVSGGSWSGTSVAAPFVAGTAALIKSIQPSWGPEQIRLAITTTVDPIPGNDQLVAGRGALNIFKAVKYAMQGGDGGIPAGMFVAVGQPTRSGISARVLDTRFAELKSFIIAPASTRGTVQMTSADINGSGVANLAVAVPDVRGSLIRIFTRDGKLLREWRPFGKKYTGSFPLFAYDINRDGKDELITAPGKGDTVIILNGQGTVMQSITLPEGGPLHLSLVREGQEMRIVSAVETRNELRVYLWDRYGSFVSHYLVARRGVTKLGVMPEMNGQFYVANLVGKNLEINVFNSTGASQATWRATAASVPIGFTFGRVVGQDDLRLVLATSKGDKMELVSFLSDGTVAATNTIKIPKNSKWQNLIYTR